jgi:hypothetical protein
MSAQFGSICSFHDVDSCAIRISPFRSVIYWWNENSLYMKTCHITDPMPIFDRVAKSKLEVWSISFPGLHFRCLQRRGTTDLELRLRNSLTVLVLATVVVVVHQLERRARRRVSG